MRKLNKSDFIVRLVPLPGCVNGVVRLSDGGFYNVYINANLSPEAQRRAVLHELRHIVRDDFYNGLPIEEVEADA